MCFEEGEVYFFYVVQYFDCVVQIGFYVFGQVGLGKVVGDYCSGVEVQLGQEYFYLFYGGVLCFIQDYECVVECVFVYVGQWCDFDDVFFQQFEYFFYVEYFVQGVVQWVQIGVDFLVEVVGQEVQFFVGFDCWVYQD